VSREAAVREIRRAHRQGRKLAAALVSLERFPQSQARPALTHYLHHALAELAAQLRGTSHDLGGGFRLLLGESPRQQLEQRLTVLFDTNSAGDAPDAIAGALEFYELPRDHVALRARLDALAPDPVAERSAPSAQDAAEEEAEAAPAAPDPCATLADALRRVVRLLDGIEPASLLQIGEGARFRRGRWEPLHRRLQMDSGLLRARMPHAAVAEIGEPLLDALGVHLDRLLLLHLLLQRPFRRHAVIFRLPRAVLTTPEFARFLAATTREERGRITIEIPWWDALEDEAGGGALRAELRRAGFRLAVGGLLPSLVSLLELGALSGDLLALDVSRPRLPELARPAVLRRLRAVDPEHLLFVGVDRPIALDIGARLGITRFEGALVERLLWKARAAAAP